MIILKRSFINIFVYLTFLSLIGCGFHLRGSIVLPEILKVIKITPDTPYESFQRKLRRKLTNKGSKIVPVQTKNVVKLQVDNPIFVQSTLALENNQPKLINIEINVCYSLYNEKGSLIQGPITIKSNKLLTINPSNLLTANSEIEVLKDELETEVVIRLINMIYKVSLSTKE